MRRIALLLVLMAALAVALAGTALGMHKATRVTARLTDYRIVLSRKSFTPGTYDFVAQNRGKVAHSLEVDGPGVKDKRISGTIAPGSSRSLTVKLRKGTYEVYCPVDGHKALGMMLKIHVR